MSSRNWTAGASYCQSVDICACSDSFSGGGKAKLSLHANQSGRSGPAEPTGRKLGHTSPRLFSRSRRGYQGYLRWRHCHDLGLFFHPSGNVGTDVLLDQWPNPAFTGSSLVALPSGQSLSTSSRYRRRAIISRVFWRLHFHLNFFLDVGTRRMLCEFD